MRHAQGPLLTIDLTERTASTTRIDDGVLLEYDVDER